MMVKRKRAKLRKNRAQQCNECHGSRSALTMVYGQLGADSEHWWQNGRLLPPVGHPFQARSRWRRKETMRNCAQRRNACDAISKCL